MHHRTAIAGPVQRVWTCPSGIVGKSLHEPIALGAADIDAALGGGLARAALHELYAAAHADAAAANAFALLLALRASPSRPILVVRQDFLNIETGRLCAAGLSGLGLDPARIVLVEVRDAEEALQAGERAMRCAALGAVVIAVWGEASVLDLTASRRLTLASANSALPVFMVRAAAAIAPSAAATRWTVLSERSRPLAANAPGFPAFVVNLVRHRGGVAGRTWCVEWDSDRTCFNHGASAAIAPLPRPLVSVPPNRPPAPAPCALPPSTATRPGSA